MAGPNLEVFKFGLYVFFPVLMLLKYGDSEWYQKNVIPVSTSVALQESQPDRPELQYRNKVFPPEEKTVRVRSRIPACADVFSPLNLAKFIGVTC